MKKFRELSGKLVVTMLAVTLLIGCAIGGTVAWLTAKTEAVVNTFTYGDINITLSETTGNDYKIIPGVDINKDPKVTVKANSEDCWLFVKVEEEGTFVANKVTYSIADGWTKGDGTKIPSDVYYRSVTASNADQPFGVLSDDKITVSEELTKAEINNLNGAAKTPKLTFHGLCRAEGRHQHRRRCMGKGVHFNHHQSVNQFPQI